MFIDKAMKVHSQKYQYQRVQYINSKTKVEITCPIHGSFWMRPDNHLAGKGCPQCGVKSRSQKQCLGKDFIEKSQQQHGQQYDYSQVSYVNNKTPVTIICPRHGVFTQLPSNHLRYGCKQCGREAATNKQTKSTITFIDEATKVHSGRYNYSKANYNGAHTKTTIICPEHGEFTQTPRSHLNGRGCPECKKGEGHPRYGKPATPSMGYFGKYRETIFRSLPELFWIKNMEGQKRDFLGLDQSPTRSKWQVPVHYTGRPGTYCADFYIPEKNEVIDIKPVWRWKIEEKKLSQGKAQYEQRGYNFTLVDADSIRVDIAEFQRMVANEELELFPAARERFKNRFGF